MSHQRRIFSSVRTEGGLLPQDLLSRLQTGADLPGVAPNSYHLAEHERIGEAVNRSWSRLTSLWTGFREGLERRPATDRATGFTRDRWLLPLFQALGYGRLSRATAVELDSRSFAISHLWHRSPIHLIGARIDLDRRQKGVAGAARSSPHGLVQDFLNRSDQHLWGFLSNGLKLRILRDHHSLTRVAYIEFDLESIMDGEQFSEFLLLWMLCHQSRVEADNPANCWLETWFKTSRDEGVQALERLRVGVAKAIETLGAGFLRQKANCRLRSALQAGLLSKQDYYRQLLRLVYRVIFLFVAEERGVLQDPKIDEAARRRYSRYYSTRRLRELGEKRRGGPHTDLWQCLLVVMQSLDKGCPELGLPALGSRLWSESACLDLTTALCANRNLLEAVRRLSTLQEGKTHFRTNWKIIGADELGSVYESLLEMHPTICVERGLFELDISAGHERKTTGSYYTPTSLVDSLLNTSLDLALDRACESEDPERAILELRICDPSVGSGHFLLAAGRRMAKRLAQVRAAETEPSPVLVQQALRDVVARCLFGVDLNPMAVELCKVNLWLEAMTPGLPLSFLDGHIRCGNSLLGTTPELMAQGIPDGAFKALEGDDKKMLTMLRKRNKRERQQKNLQTTMFDAFAQSRIDGASSLAEMMRKVDGLTDLDISSVESKRQDFERIRHSQSFEFESFLADAWCVAFICQKSPGSLLEPITTARWRGWQRVPGNVPREVRENVRRLAEPYRFFHWHLEFPGVFFPRSDDQVRQNGDLGFDVILGNPPWDVIQCDAREFFATRFPEITKCANNTERSRKIAEISEVLPDLVEAFKAQKRRTEGCLAIVGKSGMFPLTSIGRINTASLFAELSLRVIHPQGRVGMVLPSSIATDASNQVFFRHLMQHGHVRHLYDFENKRSIFPGVHSSYKFSLVSLAGKAVEWTSKPVFAFYLHDPSQLKDGERLFHLTYSDLEKINPETKTCPVFRARCDAEIVFDIYDRLPVLGVTGEDSWKCRLTRMFSKHLKEFRDQEFLDQRGFELEGNVYRKDGQAYLPVYEAKMTQIYDHRAASVVISPTALIRQAQPRALSKEEHLSPTAVPLPRYWVNKETVEAKLDGYARPFLLAFTDITAPTNQRTMLARFIPRVGVSATLNVILVDDERVNGACLLANLNALVFDFVARQKMGGIHFTFYILRQLPVLPPSSYLEACPWSCAETLEAWVTKRVVELTYTSEDMRPFAASCGVVRAPYIWDVERRFELKCELNAAYFLMYGLTLEDADHVLQSFNITKRKDLKRHGSFRTRDRILELLTAMLGFKAPSEASGGNVQTVAPPRVSGDKRQDTDIPRGAVPHVESAPLKTGDAGP